MLNSSITGAGINRLGQQAANALEDNELNIYNSILGGYGSALGGYGSALSGYGSALQGAQGNTQTGLQGLLGAASGYSGIGNQAFQNAGAQLMPAYNFWKDWQGSYDSREDFDTVVKQKQGKK